MIFYSMPCGILNLATSDIHALAVQYHRKCLIALYTYNNRMHKYCKDDANFPNDYSMSAC